MALSHTVTQRSRALLSQHTPDGALTDPRSKIAHDPAWRGVALPVSGFWVRESKLTMQGGHGGELGGDPINGRSAIELELYDAVVGAGSKGR
ncbi:hypothetical protein VE02_00066 [Pseudogymnoascus sp. 03VT05]|nr:hypothetical protein VE02_00066 [Pseudogymnoascus sp. 03VT05]